MSLEFVDLRFADYTPASRCRKGTMRRAFEDWVIDNRKAPILRNSRGEYLNSDVEWMWQAFVAGSTR